MTRDREAGELDARADALRALADSDVPLLVAGAYAFFEYTGIFRDTKDLDMFLRERDLEDAFRALERAGFRTELLDPSWIGKGYRGEWFVDLIFSSGNGVAVVDDAVVRACAPGRVMGVEVLLAPPEEIIWSKGFVLERERYDGADVNHLLRACGAELDWDRLLMRFDRYWEVLFSHLMLYRFAYPCERDKVPERVLHELLQRTRADLEEGNHARAGLPRHPHLARAVPARPRAPRATRTGAPGTRRSGPEGRSAMADGNEVFRLAAVADLHCRQDQHGRFRELVKMVNGEAEGLVLARRSHRPRHDRRGEDARRGVLDPARAVRRGAREPRLRGRAS